MLLICAVTAAIVACIALLANAQAAHSLPQFVVFLWTVAALGIVQIICCVLIWRTFLVTRRLFAQRLQAVTGGLDDRIFLADASGNSLSMLSQTGWAQIAMHDWLDSIHVDDRSHWPIRDADGQQRIELRLKGHDGEWRWHSLRATPLTDDKHKIREWVGALHDIHDQKIANEHRDLVIGELRHRLKNLLTVIDALAKNSRRSESDEPGIDAFLHRFLGRLHALGAAGDLVLAGDRVAIEVTALVRATLAPFMDDNAQRVRFGGPPLRLTEETGAGLGLALHELATNALKYGALSVPDGAISFTWSVTQSTEGEQIAFVWKEQGGPAPAPPAMPGFGTRMIQSVASREKAGKVEIEYFAEGLLCRISFIRPITVKNVPLRNAD